VHTPRPGQASASEEELLVRQWDFLDRLVDRQAALLRSGVQDSEEVDEPLATAGAAELRRELTALRAALETAEAGRLTAETVARQARADLTAAITAHRHLIARHERSLTRLAALEKETHHWRRRAEALDREVRSLHDHLERTRRSGRDHPPGGPP
jgi:chromosome segregation ATPase